jgi:Mrp family chromosome partitioning ATPase
MNPSSPTAMSNRLQEYIHYSELKKLAYAIAGLQQEKMFYSLAVLSFFPGEGKTLFCAALAMAYAETCHEKVLVIDTTTIQNKRSLVLRDCFNGSTPLIDIMSLDELRKKVSNGNGSASANRFPENDGPALDSEVVHDREIHLTTGKENDFSLLKKVTKDRSWHHGLMILDTAPLHARNRGNIDPSLVARLSDASVLVASRKFLDAPNLTNSLKVLEDPSLHLLGMVSNEGLPL